MRATTFFDRPLDRALQALRTVFPSGTTVYRWTDDLDSWVALCPVCRFESVFTLTITEMGDEPGSAIRLECWNGCDERLIRIALCVDPPTELGRSAA
jgi:hypothetical protein